MGLVVQKYGGSSVADAEGIKRVAKRIVEAKKNGNQVVAVVSAMGDTTDELIDLAEQVSPIPAGRELDMLLTAGERISMALLAMAIKNLGHEAQSFTGSQAGVITDSVHNKARIIDVTPGRIRTSVDEGNVAIVAGFQGVSQDSKDITTLGRGGSDTTAVALAAALDADVCEIYTDVDGVFTADPRVVPKAKKIDWISFEDMLELAASGSKVLLHRCVECARRYEHPDPRAVQLQRTAGHVGQQRADQARGKARGAGPRSPESHTTPPRPRTHGCRRARQAGRGGRDLPRHRRRPGQHRHGRAERVRRLHGPDGHLVRRFPSEGREAIDALEKNRPGIGFDSLRYDDQIGKISLVGAADDEQPGRHRRLLHRALRRGGEHRADLDLRDPHLGRHPQGRRERGRARRAHRLRLDSDVTRRSSTGTGR
ncbi:Aspartokinase OS=Streptomyces tendae OX=1932 GN=GUR47_19710 PE=3 SV=1 [Streptomyces tendae]